MKRIKLGIGFAIFIIFFGLSVIEAFQKRNWLWAALWVITGTIFLVADNMKKGQLNK